MSGFIGTAIKALFDEGREYRDVAAGIGRMARRRPVSLTERRDASEGAEQPPEYEWSISFASRAEALRFDAAVKAAVQAAFRGEE